MSATVVVGLTTVVVIGALALYSRRRSTNTEAGENTYSDSEREAGEDYPVAEPIEFEFGEEEDDPLPVEEDVEEQSDPLPEYVADMDEITDICGVGPAKAEILREAGYETPADVFYANDEDLVELQTFGEFTVSQIRDDIGSLEVES